MSQTSCSDSRKIPISTDFRCRRCFPQPESVHTCFSPVVRGAAKRHPLPGTVFLRGNVPVCVCGADAGTTLGRWRRDRLHGQTGHRSATRPQCSVKDAACSPAGHSRKSAFRTHFHREVSSHIKQSPPLRQFIRMDHPLRDRQIEFIGHIGPADPFKPAAPVEGAFILADAPQAEFVFRIPGPGIVPVLDFGKEHGGIAQMGFPPTDFRLDFLSFLLFQTELRNDLLAARAFRPAGASGCARLHQNRAFRLQQTVSARSGPERRRIGPELGQTGRHTDGRRRRKTGGQPCQRRPLQFPLGKRAAHEIRFHAAAALPERSPRSVSLLESGSESDSAWSPPLSWQIPNRRSVVGDSPPASIPAVSLFPRRLPVQGNPSPAVSRPKSAPAGSVAVPRIRTAPDSARVPLPERSPETH